MSFEHPQAFLLAQDGGGCELRRVFSTNLKDVLIQKDLRLNWVADKAGVSRAQLYNVLSGRSSPSLDWIERVAAVVGVAPCVLLAPQFPGPYVVRT